MNGLPTTHPGSSYKWNYEWFLQKNERPYFAGGDHYTIALPMPEAEPEPLIQLVP